ncbi:hypothetical protein DPMN_100239 [Dreissena polymorpha]|uniref:Uncharacterized protein n=1 Tax=Dreissena polymorpha TaxID=45954 RepID=A0A9D4LH50_DREPO|nr:hypothetical protein DPMN_100239 [Dreissena polymorpha]
MLLSIPSKVLARIILERLKEALDKRLKTELSTIKTRPIMYRPYRHFAYHHRAIH